MEPILKILILEDNEQDSQLLKQALTKSGLLFLAKIVRNKECYENALSTYDPDIILSEYSLPTLNGIAAFQIKQILAPTTPFIIVSGTVGEENAIELIKIGITDHVLKDRLFMLAQKIKRALRDAEKEKEKIVTDEKLLKARNLYAFISQVNQNIVRVKDETTLFRNSCSMAIEFGKFKMAWIGLFNFNNKTISVVEHCGVKDEEFSPLSEVPYHSSDPQGQVLLSGKYFVCNDCQDISKREDWKFIGLSRDIKSMMVLPIKKLGHIIGTINLYSSELNFSGKDEIKLLIEVTEDISFALDIFENVKRKDEAFELIVTHENQKEFDKNNLTALINNTNDLMWSIDRDYKLITFNSPFSSMIHLHSGKHLKKGENIFSAVLSGEQANRFKTSYARAFSGEIFSEIEYTPTPLENWSEISYYPIQGSGEVVGTACHSRDITKIKKAEQELLLANEALVFQSQEKGKRAAELIVANEELAFQNREKGKRAHELSIANKELIFQNNEKEKRREELVIANNQLVYQFKQKEMMSADLIQRSKNLEQFSYIVSHNLRGPVANIMGISNVLKGALTVADQDKIQKYLFKAVEELDVVVQDLNKILQRKLQIFENKEAVYLTDLVHNIEFSIKSLIEKTDAKILTDFSSIDMVFTLKSYLHSIFYNLISNAIKYKRAHTSPLLEIKSSLHDEKLSLSFKDNGTGIDLEKHGEHLFGLYKRFHMDIEGKGLGLFMVKTQVEILQGSITVKSEPGRGTEFMIELPI